jgi:hypothetical protein
MTTDIYIAEDMKAAAALALKSRLYVSGWMLSGSLVKIKNGSLICKKMAIATKEGKAIGVAIVNRHKEVQLFVKKSERKKGIGKSLIKSLNEKNLEGFYGAVGSVEFFEKMNIKCSEW